MLASKTIFVIVSGAFRNYLDSNTHQGSLFTDTSFTGMLLDLAIEISMQCRVAWRDNVFVERLCR